MGTFTTSGAVVYRAGNYANKGLTEAYYNQIISGAECYINAKARYNFSDTFSSLNDDVKHLISEAAACMAAADLIAYDLSGASRYEAEDKINYLLFRANQQIKLLTDQKVVDFINGA